MEAITKFWQSEVTLKHMTEKALKREVTCFHAKKLPGGFCSAVYFIQADEDKLVLKIASKPTVQVMWHEQYYVPVEAKMLEIFNEKIDIKMPKLIAYDASCKLCEAPYFFMSFIEGCPLSEIKDLSLEAVSQIKYEVGKVTRQICNLPAPYFGIPMMPESYTDKNSQFIYQLFEHLIEDAKAKQIAMSGLDCQALLYQIDIMQEILDEVKQPCYIHTDTWDGNILVKDGVFSGLVDYAAILYGDPLMSHDFHDFEPQPRLEFLEGYGKETLTEHEKLRIQVYRIWQRLGMFVEPSYRVYEDADFYDWVLDALKVEINHLNQMMNS